MPGRILLVDDTLTSRFLTRTKLFNAYFEVIEAQTGKDALQIAFDEEPDLVLLDAMMPGIDGFETCRRLKLAPETAHIPVVMLTALEDRDSRLRGIDAGADDFLTRPSPDRRMLSRIESLVRSKMAMDELRLRAIDAPGRQLDGFALEDMVATPQDASLLLVGLGTETGPDLAGEIRNRLGAAVEIAEDIAAARALASGGRFDAFLVGQPEGEKSPLRAAATLLSMPASRRAAITVLDRTADAGLAVAAFDLGVCDVLDLPLDPIELAARLRVQLRRKFYADALRRSVKTSIEMASIDPLTGLYNRRFTNARLAHMLARPETGKGSNRTVAMLLDLDKFKPVNDRYGHAAGDCVLAEFAARLRANVRQVDLVARIGGEEFLVVMPDTRAGSAARVAERVRNAVESPPFTLDRDGTQINLTVSIGLSVHRRGEPAAAFLARADDALYASKTSGRNTVTMAAA